MHIHFLHNSSEGMFLYLLEELYILSAFFVSHIHSDKEWRERAGFLELPSQDGIAHAIAARSNALRTR